MALESGVGRGPVVRLWRGAGRRYAGGVRGRGIAALHPPASRGRNGAAGPARSHRHLRPARRARRRAGLGRIGQRRAEDHGREGKGPDQGSVGVGSRDPRRGTGATQGRRGSAERRSILRRHGRRSRLSGGTLRRSRRPGIRGGGVVRAQDPAPRDVRAEAGLGRIRRNIRSRGGIRGEFGRRGRSAAISFVGRGRVRPVSPPSGPAGRPIPAPRLRRRGLQHVLERRRRRRSATAFAFTRDLGLGAAVPLGKGLTVELFGGYPGPEPPGPTSAWNPRPSPRRERSGIPR